MYLFTELIEKFIAQANKGDLKTSTYPKKYDSLNIKVSFGQGVAARNTMDCNI